MPSLERNETLATGMVRPKTSALFFDKLWVHPALIKGFHDDELEPYRVPPQLCVTNPMGASDYYDSGERQKIYRVRLWPCLCGNSYFRYPCLKNFFHNCLKD